MDDTLREELDLPDLGGEIIAFIDSSPEPEYFNEYGKVLSDYLDQVWSLDYENNNILHSAVSFKYQNESHLFKDFSEDQLLDKIKNDKYSDFDFLDWVLTVFEDKQFQRFVLDNNPKTRSWDQLELDILTCGDKLLDVRKALQSVFNLFGERTKVASEFVIKHFSVPSAIEAAFPNEPWIACRIDWYLYFGFRGPDRRYSDGSTQIESRFVADLNLDLKEALKKMKSLEDSSFYGEYQRTLRNWTNGRKLSISANEGRVVLEFWVKSKNYEYSQSVGVSNLEIIIEKLSNIDARGKILADTLKKLCF